MKGPVRFFPCLHVSGLVAGSGCFFGLIQYSSGQMWCGMTQCQHFKGGAHLGYFPDFVHTETGDSNAPAWLADNKPLRFQTPKRFSHWHMARAKLFGNMILTEPGTRFERTRYDAISKRLADPHRDCVIFGFGHIL